MHKIYLFLLTCFLCLKSYAQNKPSVEHPKNVIHASLGTVLFVNSAQLSYDRLLKQKENWFFKSYYLTLKAGGNAAIDFSGNNSGTGLITSFGFTALTGKRNNHFELGLGLGYFIDTVPSDDDPDGEKLSDDNDFFPSIAIGYRKQSSEGFMFRTGIGIAEWAYVGFGYSF